MYTKQCLAARVELLCVSKVVGDFGTATSRTLNPIQLTCNNSLDPLIRNEHLAVTTCSSCVSLQRDSPSTKVADEAKKVYVCLCWGGGVGRGIPN